MINKGYRVLALAATGGAPLLFWSSPAAKAAPILPGDILVYEQDPGAVTATGVPIVIDDITPGINQATTTVKQITVPNLYTDVSGSEGSLALSAGGTLLSFSGFTSANAAEPTANPNRGAATINALGTISYPATYTANSVIGGTQPRSAYSTDGTNFYFGDKTGIYVNNGTAPLLAAGVASGNTRPIKGFGGTTYALQASNTSSLIVTLTPPGASSGQTTVTQTPLTGLPADANGLDFALVSSANNGTFDTLYYTASGKTGDNGIFKYALVNGTWQAEGSDAANGGAISSTLDGITAVNDPLGGVDLYVTDNATAANGGAVLEEIRDSAASAATISDSTPVTLYAPSSTADLLRGVSTAPVAITLPEPASLALISLGGLTLLKRRRLMA